MHALDGFDLLGLDLLPNARLRPAPTLALSHRDCDTRHLTLLSHLAFVDRERSEHARDHASGRRGQVDPILERHEVDLPLLKLLEQLSESRQRAAEAIESPDDDR